MYNISQAIGTRRRLAKPVKTTSTAQVLSLEANKRAKLRTKLALIYLQTIEVMLSSTSDGWKL
jgi:hypothetical protein